jgi:hypothetical protein
MNEASAMAMAVLAVAGKNRKMNSKQLSFI